MTLPVTESNGQSFAANPGGLLFTIGSSISMLRSAQVSWARTPLRKRLQLVRELRRLIAEDAFLLAEASASARQRPEAEVLASEVLPLAEACRFIERDGEKLLQPRSCGAWRRPLWLSGIRSKVYREPFGVVLVIGPGNYPLLIPGVQLIQALFAGNAVLIKPGVGGSSALMALIRMVHRAGFDRRLVSLLPESIEAGTAAIEARPDKVIFTGSAVVGEKILAQCAPHLIPSTMELSGCDAAIVRADADLDLTVKALKFGLTLNEGATCMAPRRVLVHKTIAGELETRLAAIFPPGRGAEDSQPLGDRCKAARSPVASEQLRHLLNEALTEGAHVVAGKIAADGNIESPLVLGGVGPSSRILKHEFFAPVLTLVTCGDDDEAIRLANDSPYALTASIFTGDESCGHSMAVGINAGVVTINDMILPTADPRLPFGGRKRSGFGATRGAEGLLELTVLKVVTVSRGRFRPAFEPAHPQDQSMFLAFLELIHGCGLRRRAHAASALFKSLSGRTKKE